MTALVSAELLRLRTIRSPRYIVLGVLVFPALLAAMDVLDPAAGSGLSPAQHADALRAVALQGVIIAAVFAASVVASDFKRGTIALTYMAHPNRWRVTVARTLTYAALGGVLAALAAAVDLAVGLLAAGSGVIDLSSGDAARTIVGALLGGAAFASLGALVGTLTRHPTVASLAVVAPTVIDGALHVPALHAYLPLGLVEQLIGLGHPYVAAPLAMVLLLAYPAAVAVVVRGWALSRDVT
jgi:ABC-type transport system involved in multi-copper enzyme maturation permease subunit